MKESLRDRIAYWFEGVPVMKAFILRVDGTTPSGETRYRNVINGHILTRSARR